MIKVIVTKQTCFVKKLCGPNEDLHLHAGATERDQEAKVSIEMPANGAIISLECKC